MVEMIRIIIDAYNLIFQCGLQPKSLNSPLALHRTRQRLVDELAQHIDASDRKDVLLVFDAKNPRGPSTPDLQAQNFQIAFARDYEDADAMVIELLEKHSQPKQLTVISSDHKIQTAASRRNAKAIDADVWFDQLGSRKTDQRQPETKREAHLSAEETQHLIDLFSDVEKSSPTTDSAAAAEDIKGNPAYNPFPPGYGEDLLE